MKRALFLAASLIAAVTLSAQQRGVFIEDIDKSADACTDFFAYANGAWRAANPIPASMDRWSRRWAAGEQSKDQLRMLLEDETKKTDWPKGSIDQQIADFYTACMDEKQIDALGMKPIEPLLADIKAMKTKADLQRMFTRLQLLQVETPLNIHSTPDNHNPSDVIAEVSPSGLGLPDRDYYFKPEPRFAGARDEYRKHLTKMFELAGYAHDKAEAASKSVFDLETKLAEPMLDNVARRDPANTDHKMTFAALQKETPSLAWNRYLDALGVDAKSAVNVSQPKYMKAVNQLLETTPLATWRTYLTWHVLNFAAPFLSSPFAKQDFAFYGTYLQGRKEMKPRWKRCVETNDQLLGEALGKRYVERYFPPEAKARMQEMVKNLLAAMGDTIRGLEWMGPETKQKALEKLSTFNPKVGYPDNWKDYSSVVIKRDAHWQNIAAGFRFDTKSDLSRIGKPLDRGLWGMTPPTSNAYYNPLLNEIVFPAGILQPPAFDVKASDAVNYGAIGVVIGHEISHGFDDQGAKYDAQGRLHDWWTADDLKRFRERTECVANQFESYFIEPNIHHNGHLVLGESIGDLAGAKIAWLAFQKAKAEHGAPTIDGLSPEEQFFVAWGQFRGDETRPETQRMMVQGDPHPVAKWRVIGPLSNIPEFAKVFGCKPGSAMIREKKCEVW